MIASVVNSRGLFNTRILSRGVRSRSVNSIASDGLIKLKLTAANAATYKTLLAAVTKAAADSAAAENAFRGVKAGDLTNGAPTTVRSVVRRSGVAGQAGMRVTTNGDGSASM